MLGDQLCREVHRSDDGDLLTEYRANGDLKAVPSAWYAQTRTLRDEWREQRISAKVIPDGQRIRAKVENAPDASHDTC
jgi:hypothetical protein